jgi:hypothetical protein
MGTWASRLNTECEVVATPGFTRWIGSHANMTVPLTYCKMKPFLRMQRPLPGRGSAPTSADAAAQGSPVYWAR